MQKPTRKRRAVASRRSKSTAEKRLHVPTPREIRRAAAEAVKVARARTDGVVQRSIAEDPDTFEADVRHLVAVRPEDVDVPRIRSRLGLSQAAFAAATGIPHRLISDWEQGRKKPSAAARAFLLLVDEFGAEALARLARRAA